MAKNVKEEFAKIQSAQDKAADKITSFAGSMGFVYVHAALFAFWIIYNLAVSGHPFDPFPFGLLTLIVSLEAIFLSTFVMLSQNRQSKQADLRSELDYEVNVKAEKEVAEIIALLKANQEMLQQHHELLKNMKK